MALVTRHRIDATLEQDRTTKGYYTMTVAPDAAMSMVLYGPSKNGKSTLAGLTTPVPRLILDTESAARFLPTKKVYWDPTKDAPPEDDGTWETCIVSVDNFRTAQKAYDYLKSGKHPFNSVILDSISELQDKAKGEISNRAQMRIQDWGTLGSKMSYLAADLRDLTTNSAKPVKAVVVVATALEPRYGESGDLIDKGRPAAEGSFRRKIQHYFDLVGYVYLAQVPNEDGELESIQCMQVANSDKFEVGSRVPSLPPIISEPDIDQIIDDSFTF